MENNEVIDDESALFDAPANEGEDLAAAAIAAEEARVAAENEANEAARLAALENETEEQRIAREAAEASDGGGEEGNSGNEDVPPLVVELQEKIGLSFKGEDGNLIEYPETTEGLVNYFEDVIEHTKVTAQEEAKTEWVNAVPPVVKDFYNHIAAGYSEESFYSDPLKDIANVVLNEDDVDTARRIVSLRYELNGYSKEDAADMIKGLEASDKLITQATKDLPFLQQQDKAIKQQTAEKVKQQVLAQEQEALKEITFIRDTIQKGTISNIEIPLQERTKFLDYLTVKDTTGKTSYMKDLEAAGDEIYLRDAYTTFKKGDLKTIIQKEVGKARVQDLRSRISRTSDKTHTPTPKKTTELNFD